MLSKILHHGRIQRQIPRIISSITTNTIRSTSYDKMYYSTTKPCNIISLLDDDFSIMYAPTDTTLSLKKLEGIDNAYELHDMIQEVLEEGNDSTRAYFYLTLKTQNNEPKLVKKPLYASYIQVINACANDETPGSAQRAQSLLNTLKSKMALGEIGYTSGEISNVNDLYHGVMKAWVKTHEKIVPVRLMELYNDMVDVDGKGFVGVKDGETYELVLSAWSNSTIPNSSKTSLEVLQHMEEHYPISLTHYKAVLKSVYNDVYRSTLNSPYPPISLAMTGYNLLVSMESRYKQNENTPDWECYTLVLKSLAKCVSREYTPMMDFFRQKMETNSSINLEAYEVVLQALAQCTHPDAPSLSHDALAACVQKYKNGDRNFIALSKEQFTLVLQAYTRNVNGDSGKMAQNVLDTLVQLGFHPDANIYALVLECYTKHQSVQERLYRANYYLKRMEESGVEPTIDTYNAYLHLKSTCSTNNQLQNRTILLTSIQTLQRLKGTITPNSTTFHHLFQACESLLENDQKTRIVQDIFALCCKYQAVTNDVLDMYKNVVSLNVYRSSCSLLREEKEDLRIGRTKNEQRLLRGGRL